MAIFLGIFVILALVVVLSSAVFALESVTIVYHSSHLQGSFHAFLPFDIGKVQFIVVLLFVELTPCVNDSWLIAVVAIQEVDDVHQRVHTINFQLVDDSRLADILLGER